MSKPPKTITKDLSRPRYRLDPPHIAPTTPAEREVYRRLYEFGSTGEFHIEDIAELVADHPPISKRLIRATNSLRFGLRSRISRLRHAIVMLGARGIREFSEPVVLAIDASEERTKQKQNRVPTPKADFSRDKKQA